MVLRFGAAPLCFCTRDRGTPLVDSRNEQLLLVGFRVVCNAISMEERFDLLLQAETRKQRCERRHSFLAGFLFAAQERETYNQRGNACLQL